MHPTRTLPRPLLAARAATPDRSVRADRTACAEVRAGLRALLAAASR